MIKLLVWMALTLKFYKASWDVVGDDIVEAIN